MSRRASGLAAVALIVVATSIVGLLAGQSVSIAAPTFSEILHGDPGGLTAADGLLPDGATAFDDRYAGVANLDADLLDALRAAATGAAADEVTLYVNSGWRSSGYQDELLAEAVAQYGSEKEAARWVATADTSPHVAGDAVDIGHSNADMWLSEHGDVYGLCQIYRNEPWHFELRPAAISRGCPRMYADPTQDPRMK
jgi:hypothetical protein